MSLDFSSAKKPHFFVDTVKMKVLVPCVHEFLALVQQFSCMYFSCGSTVQNWEIFDDPKDAKWHFDQCKFVLGTETKNIAIIQKPIKFTGKFTSTVQSLDSGYDTQSMTGTASGSKELAMTVNMVIELKSSAVACTVALAWHTLLMRMIGGILDIL